MDRKNEITMKISHYIAIPILIITMFSCEKECDKEEKVLTDTVDLTKLYPNGTYVSGEALNDDNVTFSSDSTVILKYKNNDVKYEFTYTIQTEKSYVSNQQKYK